MGRLIRKTVFLNKFEVCQGVVAMWQVGVLSLHLADKSVRGSVR